jgi:streptogramin lyase
MKSKFCRNKFFQFGMIVFLMLLIGACSSSTDTPPPSWETLTSLDIYPSFSDFTPTGQSVLYAGNGSVMEKFTFPTTGNPQGVFSTLTAPGYGIDWYTGFAWTGGNLYTANNKTMFVYSITGDSWTTPVTVLDYVHHNSQSTTDDSGFVYSLSYNGGTPYLLKYNTSGDTFEYFAAPADVVSGGQEPRAAWDSTTQRVYLTDYTNTIFYAFNPADNSFTPLASFPDSYGMSDAFCSDRRGHIFTANSSSDVTATDVWMYTAATNTWTSFTPLPFRHGDDAACTVSADGWLYFGTGTDKNFARIKVF